MTNPHIFISYSRQDKFFVHYLIDELKSRFNSPDDYPIWLDEWGIDAGRKWKPAIDSALEKSFVVLVVCSLASMKSHQVTYEWSYAASRKIEIIPILYRATLDDIHDRLREHNIIIKADTPANLNFQYLIHAISEFKIEHTNSQLIKPSHYNVGAVRESLRSQNEIEIVSGLRIAQVVGDIEFKDDLIPLTKHNREQIRRLALSSLSKVDTDKTIEIILSGFSDTDYMVRRFSKDQAIFYTRYNMEQWFEILLNEITNENKVVFNSGIPFSRIISIQVLTWLLASSRIRGNSPYYFKFADTLLELTSNENVDIVSTIINALGKLRYDKAEHVLLEFMQDNREGFYEEDDNGNIITKKIGTIAEEGYRRLDIVSSRRMAETLKLMDDAFNKFSFKDTDE